MRPSIALLLVLGILLGPGYYAYCLLFSGRPTQTIEMTERASRWVTRDGSILRFPNGLAYKPVPLDLTPGMNRVSLRLNFTFAEPVQKQTPTKLKYQASLAQLDHTILEHPITIAVARAGTQSVDVGPMEIPYPAEYLFVLEQVGDAGAVPTLSLEVIENIEQPARPIIWTGMALLVIALIVALREAITAATKRRAGR